MDKDVKYLFAHKDGKYFIKIVGSARYTNCGDFGSFVQNDLLQDQSCKDILVDLSDTDFLDSTNLGLLAKIAGFILTKFKHRMTIICPDQSIKNVLLNTGFDQIMLIIENPDEFALELENLPDVSIEDKALAKLMLDAHKTLMNINDKNLQEYKTVVDILSKELEAE